jgi:hypothetical protein
MASYNTYADIQKAETADLKNVNNMYTGMINNSDKFYNDQINAAKDYQKTQTDIQNQQTEQAINVINQNKEYQKQDYLKEQKGAYADWQKQSNQYGANAEANAKMLNSGYAESSQVQMYTAYQNRVATARQTYTRAITDYDNKIADARLQNNAKLAEIAYTTLQKTLELSLQGFQYKNTLLQQKLDETNKVKDRYYSRWSDLRNYLMQEKQFEEQVREFNKSFSSGSGGGSSRSYNYSSGGSVPSGTVKSTKQVETKKINSKPSSKNAKYTGNYTPIGLSSKGVKASNKLADTVLSKGYVTQSQIKKATKGLSKNDKVLITNSLKRK